MATRQALRIAKTSPSCASIARSALKHGKERADAIRWDTK